MTNRRLFTAKFKFQGALEALKGMQTINEIASQHKVHPTQVKQWKKQLQEQGAEVFSISMDGKGRALDNIFVERLWRMVKYEDIYFNLYETVPQLYAGLHNYFRFYNHDRPHQSLAGRSPAEVYFAPGG